MKNDFKNSAGGAGNRGVNDRFKGLCAIESLAKYAHQELRILAPDAAFVAKALQKMVKLEKKKLSFAITYGLEEQGGTGSSSVQQSQPHKGSLFQQK
jgi:hypothetical protein